MIGTVASVQQGSRGHFLPSPRLARGSARTKPRPPQAAPGCATCGRLMGGVNALVLEGTGQSLRACARGCRTVGLRIWGLTMKRIDLDQRPYFFDATR